MSKEPRQAERGEHQPETWLFVSEARVGPKGQHDGRGVPDDPAPGREQQPVKPDQGATAEVDAAARAGVIAGGQRVAKSGPGKVAENPDCSEQWADYEGHRRRAAPQRPAARAREPQQGRYGGAPGR